MTKNLEVKKYDSLHLGNERSNKTDEDHESNLTKTRVRIPQLPRGFLLAVTYEFLASVAT